MATVVTPVCLFPTAQLAAGATILATGVPGGTVVKKVVFTNVSAAAKTITVNRVASGGSVASTNILMDVVSIDPLTDFIATSLSGQVLGQGDTLVVTPSAGSSVNATANGLNLS